MFHPTCSPRNLGFNGNLTYESPQLLLLQVSSPSSKWLKTSMPVDGARLDPPVDPVRSLEINQFGHPVDEQRKVSVILLHLRCFVWHWLLGFLRH